MFSNNFKLDGIENILEDIGYMEEMKDAGEDQEHKYPKKSGKKSKDYDGDGTVEDETDEYAGVKDRAIKKAMNKDKEETEEEEKKEKKEKKESVDFSSVLDELTDEEVIFLSDTLIEEVVEEFFYETLEEGFEIDELETLLIEHVESELTYLEEAKVTVGHDSNSEVSRPSKLAKIKSAVKKVASGAKKVAKKVAGAAGEVAGSAVASYKKASAAAKDAPGGRERDDSTKDTPNSGTKSSSSAKGTKRPGLLGKIASGLKSGLKKAIHKAGKVAGKVVKTAKAGYEEGRGKTSSSSSAAKKPAEKPADPWKGSETTPPKAKPAAKKPAAKAATPATKQASAKKKSKGNLDKLLNQIRNESTELDEKKLSAPESAEKERIVRGMKKNTGEFMNRYPGKWKEVMYATATKLAKEEMELDEAGKLQGGGKDPCWKGYEMVGMKKKGGREVPNCVPKEEYEELVMDMIQEGYDMDQVREVIGALEDGYEVIFEEDGAVINDEVEQLDEESQFLSDVEMVADWLHAEGVIENEDQFFELMEDLDEEEIEELYSIVMEERPIYSRGGEQRRTQTPRQIGVKGAAHNIPKGGTTISSRDPEGKRLFTGDQDRGKGSKAARRAAALKPKEKRFPNRLRRADGQGIRDSYEMIGNSLEEGGLEVRNYSWKEVMESQYARNNPEKYEAEQKKKASKSAMPPRGDKRREDFEKWYAANVR